jgi:drug/metabolite transporter (DMT)-like permease
MTSAAPALDAVRLARRNGLLLVLAAAVMWSTGGLIVRLLGSLDSWTVVFWRSAFAAAFLIAFMGLRDGRGTFDLFRRMGLPGLVVALCFAVASVALIVALNLTSVANALVIMSSAPLVAALLAWAAIGERPGVSAFVAIFATMAGVAIMVSQSWGAGTVAGDMVALLIAFGYGIAVVTMRRHPEIRMTPAVFTGTVIAALAVLPFAAPMSASASQFALLFVFGAAQLGLGLAIFVTGARMAPAADVALIAMVEPILGPFWVWLVIGEAPNAAGLVGGAIVISALAGFIVATRKG